MMEATPKSSDTERIVTWRSLVFGFLGIFLMSGLAGYHDGVLGGTMMIGNHMPGGAFSYFMVLGIFWNGGWELIDRLAQSRGTLRDRMALSTRELIVVMAVTLVACFPPTSGLFRYFHRVIMLPWYYLSSHPDWGTHGLLTEYLRPELFPEPWPGNGVMSNEYDRVYRGFFTGLATGADALPLWKLPLGAWVQPMLRWTPLVFLMSLSIIALQFLVHRQWSRHEQLSYPVAQVASSFCQISGGRRGLPDLFKSRLFWWGFVPVFCLLMLQYLSQWYPETIPQISQMMPDFKRWDLPISTKIPILKKVPNYWAINGQTLYFTIIGLAFFVSSEISLTMGLAPFFLVLLGSLYFLGTGAMIEDSYLETGRAGTFVGYTMILLFTGRHYFRAVFARALGFGRRKEACEETEDDDVSVIAARVLMLGTFGFTIVLSWMCQSWTMAIFYGLGMMIAYLVISRIVCESGIPFVQAGWNPGDLLLRLLGPAAIGPHALTFLVWGTGVLAQDPRECLIPYVATGIKAADDSGVKLRKLFWIVIAAVGIALTVAYFSSTSALYNYNPMGDSYAAKYPPVEYFDRIARNFNVMKASGLFEESLHSSALQRLSLASCSQVETHYFFYGMIAVIACSMLRLRFSKFPIHPLLFLVAGTYPSSQTWGSFMVGWFIKMLVVRFGGGGVYQKMKPLFIGLIAGELFVIGLSVFVDFLYFFVYGTPSPIKINLMPG